MVKCIFTLLFAAVIIKAGAHPPHLLQISNKQQIWCGTWQGLYIFESEKFVFASDKEPWTN